MICIARTFGAPETVPAGKHDTSASKRSRSEASRPSTIDVRCITCEKRSSPMNCGTRTDPYSQTRPTSLRPRSTSMTCSARSFSFRFSSSASRTSSSALRPRGRVPAIGCVSTREPSTRTSISGDDPTTDTGPIRMKYMYGDGFTWRSAR